VFQELDDAWGQVQSQAPLARALTCLGRNVEANATIDAMCIAATRVPDSAIRRFPEMVRAHIAIHTGVPDALAAADETGLLMEGGEGILAEQNTLRAMVALQAGRAREAASALEAVCASTPEQGPGAAAGAALALAYAACGRAEEAARLTDDLDDRAVTYLDHLQVALARGFARSQLGDPAGAEQAFWRALEIADRSDSLLDQAVTRLARLVAWEAMGRDDIDWARDEAQSRFELLGASAPGWETAFRLAATGDGA
jgi:tetratricopeptide (TPR) repeat protein